MDALTKLGLGYSFLFLSDPISSISWCGKGKKAKIYRKQKRRKARSVSFLSQQKGKWRKQTDDEVIILPQKEDTFSSPFSKPNGHSGRVSIFFFGRSQVFPTPQKNFSRTHNRFPAFFAPCEDGENQSLSLHWSTFPSRKTWQLKKPSGLRFPLFFSPALARQRP